MWTKMFEAIKRFVRKRMPNLNTEICAFEAKVGTRIKGREGKTFEVVTSPHYEDHDVIFTIRGTDGQEIQVGMDMWAKLVVVA